MSVDLIDLEATPTLSLDPFGEMEKEAEVRKYIWEKDGKKPASGEDSHEM